MSISVASIGFVLPPKPTAYAEREFLSPITPTFTKGEKLKIRIKIEQEIKNF